ncbi:MAG: SIS domain-containing protein [Armatimonadetes bacterium]|nr:SIS domain-containing protein [Armatimonadota bacterium]
MSLMLEEIRQQPEAVARVLENEAEKALRLAREIKGRNISYLILAARGTSDNAATFGKYLFEIANGLPCALAAPSAYTHYHARLKLQNAMVLGISQSGASPDVVQVLKHARKQGALTACITNAPNSPLAHASEHILLCDAGPEKSVAATKTYTTSLMNLYMISACLHDDQELLNRLHQVPGWMEAALSLEPEIMQRVERYRYMDECVVISRGLNSATSAEMALKMAETCYLVAEPYSAADFLHGPVAIVYEGFPCFLIAPQGHTYNFMKDLAETLESKHAETIILSHEEEILSTATVPFRFPLELPEIITPIVYILFGQLFACHLAEAKGHNPDIPRGLRKVTRTI